MKRGAIVGGETPIGEITRLAGTALEGPRPIHDTVGEFVKSASGRCKIAIYCLNRLLSPLFFGVTRNNREFANSIHSWGEAQEVRFG